MQDSRRPEHADNVRSLAPTEAEDEIGRNFKLRPEFRWDYSSEHFFDGFSNNNQYTFAIDAIFNF